MTRSLQPTGGKSSAGGCAPETRLVEFASAVRAECEACYQAALEWAEKGDGYDIAAAIRARKP